MGFLYWRSYRRFSGYFSCTYFWDVHTHVFGCVNFNFGYEPAIFYRYFVIVMSRREGPQVNLG